jgi:hypothetical protein
MICNVSFSRWNGISTYDNSQMNVEEYKIAAVSHFDVLLSFRSFEGSFLCRVRIMIENRILSGKKRHFWELKRLVLFSS